MTDVSIQKLVLTDCERRIERNYYGWARERDKNRWIDETWEEATEEQRRTVALRGYALYDGCPAPQGNEITAAEIWATAGFRSRVTELDAIRILARACNAIPLLAKIPDDLVLEDASTDQLAAAGELIRCLTAYQVNYAKVTKMLHKKRPAFMPVLDSVVLDFLWKNFPHLIRQDSPAEEFIALCRTILLAYKGPVERIRTGIAEKGFLLTTVRVLDWILWMGWRDKVDEYGFGRPIVEVWEASSLSEARAKASDVWSVCLCG